MNTSRRGSSATFFANASTDSWDARSRSHTSQMPVVPVDLSMDCRASSPAERLRTARMTFAAPRRVKCLAASRPRPTLEPVIMIVWLVNDVVG